MGKIIFDTWAGANSKAREWAMEYECSTKIGRENSKFYVEVLDGVEGEILEKAYEEFQESEFERLGEIDEENMRLAKEKFDSEWQPDQEIDELDVQIQELQEEISGNQDDIGRSQEDGWYYDDNEPD